MQLACTRLAHIHHVIERFSMSDGTPAVYIWMEACKLICICVFILLSLLAACVVMSVFQLTYTSVFGAYTSYIFLRTGQFVALHVHRSHSLKRI